MFCDKCGAENRDGAEYCVKCGVKLTDIRAAVSTDEKTVAAQPSVETLDYVERFKLAVSDRYDVIRELGRGGMAVVFLAKDKRLERMVALKLLPKEISLDKNFAERFLREARISAKLSHPNIIQIHDVEHLGDFTYYSMSFIDGISLAQIIKKGGAVNPKILVRLGLQICFAIQHAHEKGVIHRDIKPENILINKQRMPIVLDFGIARAKSDARLSSTGMFIGTPQYMSPEQIKGGEVDHRSDIYSLGGVLYEMAVGRPAFRASDTAALMYKQVHDIPEQPYLLNPALPKPLSDIIMKALEKNPFERPQSAKELGMMLYEFSQTGTFDGGALSGADADESGGTANKSDDMQNVETVAVESAPEPSQTILMDSVPHKLMVPDEPAPAVDDTVAMKKRKDTPPKKEERKEEKKGVSPVLAGIIALALLGAGAFGAMKFLGKSAEPPVFPVQHVQKDIPEQPSAQQPEKPADQTPAEPPQIERKVPQKRELQRQDTPVTVAVPKQPVTAPQKSTSPVTNAELQKPLSVAQEPERQMKPPPEKTTEATLQPSLPEPQKVVESRQEVPRERIAAPQSTPSTTTQRDIAARTTPAAPEPSPERKTEQPAQKTEVSIQWIRIPGGTFEMGDHVGDIRKELLSAPVHRVTLSAFEISKTEVTVAQYSAFITDTGHEEPSEWQAQKAIPDRPVIFVSWYDADAFARWAGARLPTEAEWEYAARGGFEGQLYPWGAEPPQEKANLGNPWGDGKEWRKYLMKPGLYPANGYGLVDMAGNVWEWTADRFGPYSSGLTINPAGSQSGNMRVMRGGAWNSTDSYVRNAVRGPSAPDFKGPHVGFRIARNGR